MGSRSAGAKIHAESVKGVGGGQWESIGPDVFVRARTNVRHLKVDSIPML